MRAFIELIALVSQDADQLRKLVDIDQSIDDTDADTASTFSSTHTSLAASAANVPVDFGGVTKASMFLILAYDDITVRLNDITAPPVRVLKTPAVDNATVLSNIQKYDQPGIMLVRGRVDSAFLTNLSSTAAAKVYVALVGEAA